MENKKPIKISLITFLVIILIIFILIAIFLFFNVYKLKKNNSIENSNLVDEDSTNVSNNDNTNDLYAASINLFTEENIKTCLSNYLELYSHANCDNLLEDLTKMEVLDYDPSKDTISDTGAVTTHILFSDYKKAMLNYVSEKEFQKNWYQSLYYSKNSNGYLTKLQGGGGLCTYTIKNINKVDNLTYFAKTYSIVEDDISTRREENFTFTVTNYNNKCVVDSIIAQNSNETSNITNTNNIDTIAKNLFEKGSLKIRETLYTDYYEYPTFSPLEEKEINGIKYQKKDVLYSDVKKSYSEIFTGEALDKVLNRRFVEFDGFLYVSYGGATGWDITNVTVSKTSNLDDEVNYIVKYNDVEIDDSISEEKSCNMKIKYIDGNYKISSTDYCDF